MKLSIIIVSWNVEEKLEKNLEELYKSDTGYRFEVFVVDNNSSDGTVGLIKDKFPQVNLIANDKNLGFAKANNMAIKKASGEYILLLNPDMQVQADTLEKMIDWFDKHADVSVAGCKLINEQDELVRHVRRFPSFPDQLAIVLKIPHLFPLVLNKYLRQDFDYKNEAQVDSVRGGFFMINTNTFKKTTLLDERYFLWFEEVDFCKQVYKNGGKVVYTPVAECIDYVGRSFLQVRRSKTQKYFRDSQLKYFKKWHGFMPYLALMIAWMPMIVLSYVLDIFSIKGRAKT